MKRIIFFCFALFATCGVTIAPQIVKAQTVDAKTVFASKVNEFSASIMRSNSTKAQTAYNGAMTLIGDNINSVNLQIQNATSPTVIAALNTKKAQMQQLQTDLQLLASNVMSNASTIESKLNNFLALI